MATYNRTRAHSRGPASLAGAILLALWTVPGQAVNTIDIENEHDVEIVGKSFMSHMPYCMTKGDFNGDGKSDLAMGTFFAHDATETVFGVGLVSVFFGGSAFYALPVPPTNVQVGQLSGTPSQPVNEDVAIYGSNVDESVGTLMAAGDLDKDGYDDLIVVAQDENPHNAKPDKAKIGIFFGGASFNGLLDFSTDLNVLLSRDFAHYTAVAVGDLDHDGYDDLIVADDLTNNTGDPPMHASRDVDGAVYIVYGRARASWPATINLKGGPNATIMRASGATAFQVRSLTTGDVTGDGKADLAMGAPWEDATSRTNAGKVFLRFGGARLSGSVEIGTVANSVITGKEGNDRTGSELETNVDGHPLAIGDVNHDGIGDLVIGSPLSMLGVINSTGVGKVEVVYGRTPFPAALDLASNANVRLILGGTPRLFYTGKAVSAEDLNGDGVGDISISSHAWQASGSNPRADGVVHTVFGSNALASSYELLTEADVAFEAPPPTHRLSESKMGSCFVIGNFNRWSPPDIALGAGYGGLNTRGWVAVLGDALSPGTFGITAIGRAGSGMAVEWRGLVGWNFTVQYTADLRGVPTWTTVSGATNLPGIRGAMIATNASPVPAVRGYRVRASKP